MVHTTGHTRKGRRSSGGGIHPAFHGIPRPDQHRHTPPGTIDMPRRLAEFIIADDFIKPGITRLFNFTVILTVNKPIVDLVDRVLAYDPARLGLWHAHEEGASWILEFVCHRADELRQAFRTILIEPDNGIRCCYVSVMPEFVSVRDVRAKTRK